MEALMKAGVLLLLVHTAPVVCSGGFGTYMSLCYFLDGFLMIYCIIFTVIFFREKYKNLKAVGEPEKNSIYQELERPKEADPYQVLEPTKKKKKAAKKKKSEPQKRDDDLVQSSVVKASPANHSTAVTSAHM